MALVIAAMIFYAVGIIMANGMQDIAEQTAKMDARLSAMETALGIGLTPEQKAAAIDQKFDALKDALDRVFPSE